MTKQEALRIVEKLGFTARNLAQAKKCPFGAKEYRQHLTDIGLIDEDED